MNNNLSVIGIERSSGTIKDGAYKGQSYDNYKFHCIKPATQPHQEGQLVEIVKVKASSVSTVPALGSFIIPVYNRFGQVESIQLV